MLILTEKPSVAKDFAKALGCSFSSAEKCFKSLWINNIVKTLVYCSSPGWRGYNIADADDYQSNYSDVVNWSEAEFTVAGPGSHRGIEKCFEDKGKLSDEDIIKYMYEHQDEEFKRLGLNFKRIGNRPLQLIDCQNIFCEVDKYLRQAKPELKSNRTKIKKK